MIFRSIRSDLRSQNNHILKEEGHVIDDQLIRRLVVGEKSEAAVLLFHEDDGYFLKGFGYLDEVISQCFSEVSSEIIVL